MFKHVMKPAASNLHKQAQTISIRAFLYPSFYTLNSLIKTFVILHMHVSAGFKFNCKFHWEPYNDFCMTVFLCKLC